MKYFFALLCVFKGTVKDGDMSKNRGTVLRKGSAFCSHISFFSFFFH